MPEAKRAGYFSVLEKNIDPKGQGELRRLKCFIAGKWVESKTTTYRDAYNPSTGEIIAKVPACTGKEILAAVTSAREAFVTWSATPPIRRVQVLFKLKALMDEHLEELTRLLCLENGKAWQESMGDVLKAIEVVEYACGIPALMKGESLFNCSRGYDTVQYLQPLGVVLGLVPWNFPAMIPHGWMAPLAIAAGNSFVLKAASAAPQSALRISELWAQAGLPPGVLNVIMTDPADTGILLDHPDIKAVSFVGSSSVGKKIYSRAAAAGKRVQVLGEAKNHALVLADCNLERTAAGIVNAFCGCAGERCMALPVVVVEEAIADGLLASIIEKAKSLVLGPAYDQKAGLGPLVHGRHREGVIAWIEKGIKEGAKLVLDGRKAVVKGYEGGFYLGPTIFDHVKPGMSVGEQEIFGPVLCVKRVKNFEEGLAVMNANPFANGSVIYTQSGHYAREFAVRTDGGMVGVNVGIPVPLSIFGFTGQKNSFFGDLHVMGRDGVRFYTKIKNVTTTWFPETEQTPKHVVDTWDGMLDALKK